MNIIFSLLAPGLLRKAESFDIWSTDSCRKLTFERAGSLERHGLTVDRFQLADNVFDNGTACEGNLCYQASDYNLNSKNFRHIINTHAFFYRLVMIYV